MSTPDILSTQRPTAPHIILSEMMDAQGMTCERLAELSWLTFDVCTAMLLGDCKIDRPRAFGLALAFGTSIEYWEDLQRNHDNWQEPNESV